MQEKELDLINCLLEDNSPVGISNAMDGLNIYGEEYIPDLDEIGRCKEDGLFLYYYLGEDDSLFDDEQDVNFVLPLDNGGSGEIENFFEIDETIFCDMPEVRSTIKDNEETPDWLVEMAGGKNNYWSHHDEERVAFELEIARAEFDKEIHSNSDAMLPGCRFMTVRTKRGKGLYEYVSVRDGTTRTAKSGKSYHHEIRYPLVRGELRSQRSGRHNVDAMADEELQTIGIVPFERSADVLLRIVRSESKHRV